jgi:hypothetical protein
MAVTSISGAVNFISMTINIKDQKKYPEAVDFNGKNVLNFYDEC